MALSGVEPVSSASDSATAAKVLGLPSYLGSPLLSEHLPLAAHGLAQDARGLCCADRERPRCFSPRYHRGWRLAGAGPEEMPTARGIATPISCRTFQGQYDPACGSSSAMSSWRQSFSTLHEGVEFGGVSAHPTDHAGGSGGDREKASAGSDSPAWIRGYLRWLATLPARQGTYGELGQPAAYGLSPTINATVAPSKSQASRWGTPANHCESRKLRIYGRSCSRK